MPQALRLQLGNLHVSQLHSDAPEPSTCRSYHTARSARSGTSSRSERSKHSLKKERKERKGKRSEDGRLDVARSSGASERLLRGFLGAKGHRRGSTRKLVT